MEAFLSRGYVPQDVVSFLAVASHVLLLTAPSCDIEQAAQALLPSAWTKPEQSSPASPHSFSSASIPSVQISSASPTPMD